MIKEEEDFNLKLYKTFDVSELNEILNSWSDEWEIDTTRQETQQTHRRTHAYYIHKHPLDWKLNTPYLGQQICTDEKIMSFINPIVKELELFIDGKVGQCIFVELEAYDFISPHKDSFDYLLNSRRFHIPIITNDEVTFTVNEESVNMKQGECWEINNAKIHHTKNMGSKDRVHLIFDIIPNKFLA